MILDSDGSMVKEMAKRKPGFQLTERDSTDVLAMITVLNELQSYDISTTKLVSPETFSLEQQYAGNVEVEDKLTYELTLFNAGEEDKTLYIELQKATTLMATAIGLLTLSHLI